jgi:UDP-2-acetamido-2,6-beta-L-arabino-hexul-4-ose reductase
MDNPYGQSKLAAEGYLRQYAEETGAVVVIFRFTNIFGKWCRPNYNSAVATFCHNIAHHQPVTVSDPARELELVYIDDVVASLAALLDSAGIGGRAYLAEALPSRRITLGDLVARITQFRAMRTTLTLPDFSDRFIRNLYATYLSYLSLDELAYPLEVKADARGALAEFIKSASLGQIFVSRTRPGITRGNHYHHTKTEKFLVLEGEGIIRFRLVTGGEVASHHVSGQAWRVVDIPPGTTHSIENVGQTDLITLFWSSEVFDPKKPDATALEVNLG